MNELLSPAAAEKSWLASKQAAKKSETERVSSKKTEEEEEEEEEVRDDVETSDSDDDFIVWDRGDDDDADQEFEEDEEEEEEDGEDSDLESEVSDDDLPSEEETSAAPISLPFWYSYEDDDQIKGIIEETTKFLGLDKEAAKCVRAPPPYIARIKRTWVRPPGCKEFQTFDRVCICERTNVAPGKEFPRIRKEYLLTTWDREEGLPKNFVRCTPQKQKRLRECCMTHCSFLYCIPRRGSSEDCCFASKEKQPIVSPSDITVYDPFLLQSSHGEEDEDQSDENPDEGVFF